MAPAFRCAQCGLQSYERVRRYRVSRTRCSAGPGTRELPRRTAASCEEPTFTCGRIRSIVSGLLFTMKTATRTCEPSARDIVLARDCHAIFELDDVRARNLLVEVCSNAWPHRMGPAPGPAAN